MAVGAGLLNTLQLDTPEPRWIGFQILYGFGMGCTLQAPNLAAQTVLPKKDVSIGITLMVFGQLTGGAAFISVGQNVLNSQLMSRLMNIPGVDAHAVSRSGATSLVDLPAAIRLSNSVIRLLTVFWSRDSRSSAAERAACDA